MGDFYQNGVVATLHKLRDRPLEELEAELLGFSSVRPMTLVLPSLFSELEGPALANILDEISVVPYLDEIVIGLDKATEEQFRYAQDYFGRLPQHHRILWNDGPRLRALDKELAKERLAPKEMGKGRNVWFCFGYTIASARSQVVALHDCDILTYNRELLARLCYPIANPTFSYQFCKGYYPRVTEDRMHGRVCRLLVSPLIRALTKVLGPIDFLEYLNSFRYPLAGEFSLRSEAVKEIRIPSDWGLEIGVLAEVHKNHAAKHRCQIEIAETYDHKHQPLSEDSTEAGLSKMSIDIAKTFYRKLSTNGAVFYPETFRTIKSTYYRIALDFVDMYDNDARLNGIRLDRHAEEKTVELFAANLMQAGEAYLDNPMDIPVIPCWSRVSSAIPDFLERMHQAVEADNTR